MERAIYEKDIQFWNVAFLFRKFFVASIPESAKGICTTINFTGAAFEAGQTCAADEVFSTAEGDVTNQCVCSCFFGYCHCCKVTKALTGIAFAECIGFGPAEQVATKQSISSCFYLSHVVVSQGLRLQDIY